MASSKSFATLLLLGVVVSGCGGEDAPPAPPTAASAPASADADSREAKHGGVVTRVGTHPVEVVTHASGEVYAYVERDIANPATNAMRIEVQASSGRQPVVMTWDARRRRYEGRVLHAEILAGPVNVHYVVDGIPLIAIIPVAVLAPVVEIHVDHRHHGKHKWRH